MRPDIHDIHDVARAARLALITLVSSVSFAMLSCTPAPATAAPPKGPKPAALMLPTGNGTLSLYLAAGPCKVGLHAYLKAEDGPGVHGCWDADQGQAVVALADGRRLEVDLAKALGAALGMRS